ncbi:hypothetical protein, unlikely [Trypanosoma brucei brucei TREU927]|uniref:Uncharacterized protein n=1 Tax=Trypanosoma brucei brucei (strain 927/4 GUTat10.1) TaxID=185431 RepID=Q38ER7_TRYB2|nr:hypothetical protein, unlikely [Trypanosoma brucei brucei TREU927]EAN76703.1 hypothetical protein, unlikely [Trypanosoma brucei brucei TREU927]
MVGALVCMPSPRCVCGFVGYSCRWVFFLTAGGNRMCLEFETDSFRGDYHCPAFRGSSDSTVPKNPMRWGLLRCERCRTGEDGARGRLEGQQLVFPTMMRAVAISSYFSPWW